MLREYPRTPQSEGRLARNIIPIYQQCSPNSTISQNMGRWYPRGPSRMQGVGARAGGGGARAFFRRTRRIHLLPDMYDFSLPRNESAPTRGGIRSALTYEDSQYQSITRPIWTRNTRRDHYDHCMDTQPPTNTTITTLTTITTIATNYSKRSPDMDTRIPYDHCMDTRSLHRLSRTLPRDPDRQIGFIRTESARWT